MQEAFRTNGRRGPEGPLPPVYRTFSDGAFFASCLSLSFCICFLLCERKAAQNRDNGEPKEDRARKQVNNIMQGRVFMAARAACTDLYWHRRTGAVNPNMALSPRNENRAEDAC